MQEEVNQKTVALSIRTTKLTGKVLAAALGKVARALQKHHRKALTPQGRQSVKKLMNHYRSSSGNRFTSKSFRQRTGNVPVRTPKQKSRKCW